MTGDSEEKTPKKAEEPKAQKKVKNKKDAARTLDPAKFSGDGMLFRGKIIGIDDVTNPRGDQMCQQTMQKLKAAVKSQGEHKQRIHIHVQLTGMKILDDKTKAILHEHAVHRISFISRDITDARAFGYVYGFPDGTHKFFAIKTEKASEAIVLTLRDLFQVVYELKKKEMEEAKAKQNDEHHYENMDSSAAAAAETASSGKDRRESEHIYEVPKSNEPVTQNPGEVKVERLLDLETELESIQQGIMHMDSFADPFQALETPDGSVDPFGSSFNPPNAPSPDPFVVRATPSPLISMIHTPTNVLSSPPDNNSTPVTSTTNQSSSADQSSSQSPAGNLFKDDPFFSSTPAPQRTTSDKYSAIQELSVIDASSSNNTFLDATNTMNDAFAVSSLIDVPLTPAPPPRADSPEDSPTEELAQDKDPFSELCPLGSGLEKKRKKPKDMFAEMQSPPPRKTLNQMIEETNPVKFVSEEDPFAVAPSPVRKGSNPIPTASFQAFEPDPTNPFASGNTSTRSIPTPPPKPARFEGQGDCSLPSPDIPPPPLPAEIQIPSAPVPPPRPRPVGTKVQKNDSSLPKLQPPVMSPPKTTVVPVNPTIKSAVYDPFASDPFFTTPMEPAEEKNNNNNTARDPFAVFDKEQQSPFLFKPTDDTQQEAVYATVTKPKRSS